jgi:hypothetical protein
MLRPPHAKTGWTMPCARVTWLVLKAANFKGGASPRFMRDMKGRGGHVVRGRNGHPQRSWKRNQLRYRRRNCWPTGPSRRNGPGRAGAHAERGVKAGRDLTGPEAGEALRLCHGWITTALRWD